MSSTIIYIFQWYYRNLVWFCQMNRKKRNINWKWWTYTSFNYDDDNVFIVKSYYHWTVFGWDNLWNWNCIVNHVAIAVKTECLLQANNKYSNQDILLFPYHSSASNSKPEPRMVYNFSQNILPNILLFNTLTFHLHIN